MRIVAGSVAFTAVVSLICSGCGSQSDASHFVASTVPVKGKVLYKGKPLTQGEITFEPLDSGREAHGRIQPDGTFELTTFNQGDGAVPGTHRVAVTGTGGKGKSAVALKYKNPSSSKTEIEVAEGKLEYSVDLR
jgi:hypothetical protein